MDRRLSKRSALIVVSVATIIRVGPPRPNVTCSYGAPGFWTKFGICEYNVRTMENFRARFFHDGLETWHVVPVAGDADATTIRSGTLAGADELLGFIREIGFNFAVYSSPGERADERILTFRPSTPRELVVAMEATTFKVFAERILEAEDPKAAAAEIPPPPGSFVLGTLDFDADEGVCRVREYFKRRDDREGGS